MEAFFNTILVTHLWTFYKSLENEVNNKKQGENFLSVQNSTRLKILLRSFCISYPLYEFCKSLESVVNNKK